MTTHGVKYVLAVALIFKGLQLLVHEALRYECMRPY